MTHIVSTKTYRDSESTRLTFLKAFKSFLESYSVWRINIIGRDRACCPLTLGQSLQGCQGLTTVPLLNTDMDVIGLRPNVVATGVERISFVCEGVCGERGKSASLSTESIAPWPI